MNIQIGRQLRLIKAFQQVMFLEFPRDFKFKAHLQAILKKRPAGSLCALELPTPALRTWYTRFAKSTHTIVCILLGLEYYIVWLWYLHCLTTFLLASSLCWTDPSPCSEEIDLDILCFHAENLGHSSQALARNRNNRLCFVYGPSTGDTKPRGTGLLSDLRFLGDQANL